MDHRCFIQPVAKQNKTGNADPDFEAPLDDDSDEEDKKAPPPPPIPVFADIECYQDEDWVFHANLICWSSAEEDEIHHSDKIDDFLAALEELTGVEGDERERKVVSFFHNMWGFHGNFILEKLYDQGRAVQKPLTQGAKIICLLKPETWCLKSMNFFNMGLDEFPETFNLQGFFPLAFNRVENFSYRGVYPSADQYSPDDTPEKKREKFLAWHTEKIRENAVCDFHEEVVRYCESDVQLLKEGCLKFIEEFEEIAGFSLLIESVTIASPCNLFCRREKLEEDLIAIKPQNGWRGNRVNQSKVALEWLYFEDWKLGGVS